MVIELHKIQKKFNRASHTYDKVANAQLETAKFLATKIQQYAKKTPKSILDCGAGTGNLTEILLQYFPNSSYYLNDISSNMLEQCRIKFSAHNNINFIQNDMSQLDNNNYDFVVSNLALQWLPDVKQTLQLLYNKSNKILAFTTLLPDTFAQWFNLLQKYQTIKTLTYLDADELIEYCRNLTSNFIHGELTIDLNFKTPKDFLIYLRSLGAGAALQQMNYTNLRKLINNEKTELNVSYKIFIGLLFREN